ncbi:E3 ubiquitin-protein ligase EL5-like [Dioscorea cayenensis subsp. rotundata]|uniref:RING-type E3 ubiquitin transferase n=1 Tax=Dioscorea cayennensis subsp. rotundata TaxID=55577 RepID=A0AB40D4P7_DIOCR|nr:E3 ubiquitin-protein ligase EL5-like [Dioscorea cayenensis subsp. rotundata]
MSTTTNSGTGIVIGTEIIVAGVIFFFMLVAFAFFIYFYTIGRHHLRGSSHSGDAIPTTTLELRTSTGLEEAVIQSIPVVRFSSSDGVECAVCLSDIGDGEKARLLPLCKHGFHLVCIDVWLSSHSTCPLCRCDITGKVAGGTTSADNQRLQRVDEIQVEVIPALDDETPSMDQDVMNSSNRNKTPVSSSPRLRSLTRLWSQGKRTMAVASSSSSLSTREGDIEDQGMHN